MIIHHKYSLSHASRILNIREERLRKWKQEHDKCFFDEATLQTVDEQLCEYYMEAEAAGQHCPDSKLKKKLVEMARDLNYNEFTADKNFLTEWRQRCFKHQREPAYEETAKKVRMHYKTLYEEGRECSLQVLTERAVSLAKDMPLSNDPGWLHKWKLHYFADADDICVPADNHNNASVEA
jgi:hypothetical protein